MQLQEKQKAGFINFGDFLEIPMDSLIEEIQTAFANKFEKIENAIKNGNSNSSLEELQTCIKAYETLRDSYLRLLHNCEIEGEEPPKDPDWDALLSSDAKTYEDEDENVNQSFLEWLFFKIQEYTNKTEAPKNSEESNVLTKMLQQLITDIIQGLSKLLVREEEIKKMHQTNKRTMHK